MLCWNQETTMERIMNMLDSTFLEQGTFKLLEKERPVILDDRDVIVRVTLASICTSDLHIKYGSVP